VAVFALEPGVTLDRWIDREFPPSQRAALHKRYPDGAARGELLYVRTVVDGHKHRDVTLRYGVYDAARHTRVPARNIDGPQLGALPLSAPSERSVKVLWVPDLSFEPGRLFIRVELWDDDGMLAVGDSPPVSKGRLVQLQG
jgi:hypothetical protein